MVAFLQGIAQSSSSTYQFSKDMFLYAKRQKRDIEALEERISKLILHLSSIKSSKEKIERTLKYSVFKEETDLYKATKADIAVIQNKFIKYIQKYTLLTTNQLSPEADFDAGLMIEKLGDLKSNMVTFSFFKLAKLSREVEKLSTRASEAAGRLKSDNMIQKRSGPNLERMDAGADDVLPVFDEYVDKILEYLEDRDRKKIGILGCQGVGKTTVMKKVRNRLHQLNSFEHIIWIEYLPEMEKEEGSKVVESLQSEIMVQLDIHGESVNSVITNADTISAFLLKKKYVLLMDDVSIAIDLDKLGFRDDHKFKKVVICSREKKVVDKMTEHKLKIKGLDGGEALMLFERICGKSCDENALAMKIIECCEGIPWMIRNMAVHLRDKEDDESWHYVKRILQSKPGSSWLIDLAGFDKVYEVKYEGLEEADAKKCLLYGALFPQHHRIYTDYLVECWIAEGFLVEEAGQRVRANRERGRAILNKLTDDDLLQWRSGKEYVMMPSNFRRVALGLKYPGEEESAIWAPSMEEKPRDTAWTTARRMSLIGCKMELPQAPQCSNIHTLLMESFKQEAECLPSFFFHHMESLQLLNLNQTEIRALPGSIEKLVNLKGLYLNGCLHLASLPPEAARLQKLEFLDICGTWISTLPEEIRSMASMRCLRASLSAKRGIHHKLKGKKVDDSELIIPPGIISGLRNLEELCIDATFDFDQAERLAIEIASLEYLNTLCFNFPNVSSLSTFVKQSKALKNKETHWENTFRSFKISIGSCPEARRSCHEPDSTLTERWLRYSTNEEFSPPCQELLKKASAFEIIGRDGLESLTCSEFDLRSVKLCVVERCNNMKHIVDGYITTEEQVFSKVSLLHNLKKLHLYDLKLLTCIWDGTVPPSSLAKLTTITIDGCPNLTKILDPALAQSLKSLEYLKVKNCGKISMIIERCSDETSEIVELSSESELLKNLRKIELSNLPELRSICESSEISWNSLKSIVVMRCSNLRNLPLTPTNARKLESIQCEESWWNTLIPDELKQRLHKVSCFQERGEASSSGSLEGNQTSDINVNYEEEMSPSDDHAQASQMDVKTNSSNLDDDGSNSNAHDWIQAGQLAPDVHVRQSGSRRRYINWVTLFNK